MELNDAICMIPLTFNIVTFLRVFTNTFGKEYEVCDQ